MIKDSGDRTKFDTGAVRDMGVGKGRCDLLPLDVVASCMGNFPFEHIDKFQHTGEAKHLIALLQVVKDRMFNKSWAEMFLELSIHFEEGAIKYGDRNWEKGIPIHSFIDSAIRHFLKWNRGETDERHDRAFVWNIVCCIWTVQHCEKKYKCKGCTAEAHFFDEQPCNGCIHNTELRDLYKKKLVNVGQKIYKEE